MTYTTSNSSEELVSAFQSLGTDDQLALFWFVYTEMGESITPAAPGASTVSPEIAEGLYNQVKEKSQEEQLQIQRDLIEHKNTMICREYGALSDTTKLLFWYRLSQGMDAGEIIPVPPGYELSGELQQVLEKIKAIDFGEQITLFRNIVGPMGVDPTTAEHDESTGL